MMITILGDLKKNMRITENDLEEGEVICNKCEGGGSWPQLFLEETKAAYYRCPKCHGDGKLDWVYAVTGKPATLWFNMPKIRKTFPKLIASEIVGVQPMVKEVSIWQKAVTSLRGLKRSQQSLTISSKEKEDDGTTILPEKKYRLF